MKLPEKLTSLKAYDPITGSYAVRLDAMNPISICPPC